MAQPREIELKLDLPVGQLMRLRRLPVLRGVAPGKSEKLVSIYFDTDKRQLRKRGLSLRIRRDNGRQVQTVKQRCGSGVGLFQRNEWEQEIRSSQPDLDAARDTALRPLIGKKLRRRLKPVFTTQVRRQTFPISRNGSSIALAVDQGKVHAKGRSAPLCELELELTNGEAHDLFAVARALEKQIPLYLASRSKGGQGYALLDKEQPQPVKAEPIALAEETDWATAFQVIARSCLYQFVANEPALRRDDLEAVHQMRVALRRLRAATSLFADMLEERQTETMKARLKQFTNQLGPVRELDVFISRALRPLEQLGSHGLGTDAVAKDVRHWRAAALAKARKAVASAGFRHLVLDSVTWVEIGDWTRNEASHALRQAPVAATAAKELRRRSKKIAKRGAHLDELDPRRRHKLRVNVKKLRYACAFFAGAFPGKWARRGQRKMAGKLKQLQSALGELNDIVVDEGLARKVARSGSRQPRKAFASGRLAGREEARFA